MTRDQLINIVLRRLGQRQNDIKLRDAAVEEQQIIQQNVLEGADFRPWFLLSEYEQTTVNEGEYKVSLPTRFLEEWEEGALWYLPDPLGDPSNRLQVPKGDYDYLSAKYPSPGVLRGYSIAGTYFLLSPALYQSTTLQMRYYRRELVMDDAFGAATPQVPTNKWTQYAADWYMGELGFVLAKYHTRDADAAQNFAADAAKAKNRVYVETVARQEANVNRMMGED